MAAPKRPLHPVMEQLAEVRNATASRRTFAAASGYDHASIGRYERGETEPAFTKVSDLAQALGFELALRPSKEHLMARFAVLFDEKGERLGVVVVPEASFVVRHNGAFFVRTTEGARMSGGGVGAVFRETDVVVRNRVEAR